MRKLEMRIDHICHSVLSSSRISYANSSDFNQQNTICLSAMPNIFTSKIFLLTSDSCIQTKWRRRQSKSIEHIPFERINRIVGYIDYKRSRWGFICYEGWKKLLDIYITAEAQQIKNVIRHKIIKKFGLNAAALSNSVTKTSSGFDKEDVKILSKAISNIIRVQNLSLDTSALSSRFLKLNDEKLIGRFFRLHKKILSIFSSYSAFTLCSILSETCPSEESQKALESCVKKVNTIYSLAIKKVLNDLPENPEYDYQLEGAQKTLFKKLPILKNLYSIKNFLLNAQSVLLPNIISAQGLDGKDRYETLFNKNSNLCVVKSEARHTVGKIKGGLIGGLMTGNMIGAAAGALLGDQGERNREELERAKCRSRLSSIKSILEREASLL